MVYMYIFTLHIYITPQMNRSPLHYGCSNGYRDICNILITKHADIHIPDKVRRQCACTYMCMYIWSRQKDIYMWEKCEQYTLLMFSMCLLCLSIYIHISWFIIEQEGNTPLHVACWRRKFDIAIQLLEYGASLHIANEVSKLYLTGRNDGYTVMAS